MPTSSRPRRAALLTALTVGGALFLSAPNAVAQPGHNGDVNVHMAGTASAARLNEPKICKFYLDAFNFDVAEGINWTIEPQTAQAPANATLSGVVTLANGAGVSGNLMLPVGRYRLNWTVVDQPAVPRKTKLFNVDCSDRVAGVLGPNGGPAAGGGGLARAEAYTPVAGAAAVGVAAVGGAVWFRRRRINGAA
ncbi:hypothetical protein [Streptomyces sp. NL15-2K]|uniref:hypothetical protein n=1 Tax=Streptomyces sp. NL15-2K TaxID=376149 RepID=UPI000F5653E7|nr:MULTISPECIES: hypothetical protein [Actinomycetes]WKX07890.1 hypothetical protein Q4V64_10555 [Kutzneria buriramensis]GCB50665.1 hypothetical protein SNL152K_8010 [Streptomyces sp. NL15-2K]